MKKESYSLEIGHDKFTVEITPLAEQAHGRVLVRYVDTMVLATVVMAKKPREGGTYFPLMVDYEEKFYAAGKILGSRFIKRETRPSEEAVLVGRFIDRSIRPRFNLRIRNDVQVIVTVLSIDEKNDPDVASLLAASLALSLSHIPWAGPVAGVRVGKIDGKLVVNPTFEDRKNSLVDCIVSGTESKINMIEAGAQEIPEAELVGALELAHTEIKRIIQFQKPIIAAHGAKKAQLILAEVPADLGKSLKKHFRERLEHALFERDKTIRQEKVDGLKEEWMTFAKQEHGDIFSSADADYIFEEEVNDIVHKKLLEKGERPDGRKHDELRELSAEVGLLPRVHGSALFVRGQTQALSALTLGAPGEEQLIEGMEVRTKRRFMHHYNFPPYSVGEVRPMRGPGRREIGHGALAERSLAPIIPSKDEFPYTIRLVSEILSSNGSSSMASVCGSVLALMDAGVPIKKPAAGIAMGLMMNGDDYKVLTDIQGPEDHHGDMDFKAAGTKDGITGIQMDVKIEGVTIDIIRDTLAQAREARMKILECMLQTLPAPRPELSPLAPRVVIIKINPEKIGALIGPGGKIINGLIELYGVTIDIDDDGSVFVTSTDAEMMERAVADIKKITKEIKPGELLEGRVSRIFGFGAMVEVAPKQDGLIHISELAPWRVDRVEDIVNLGDAVQVIVKDIDDQGRVNLSLKDVPGRYSPEDIQRGKTLAAERQSRPPRSPRRF